MLSGRAESTLGGESTMSERDEANGRLHELDLYAWSKSTELLLIDRRIREVDWDAVAAELENSAEVNDAKPLREAVEKLLTHLTIWNVSADYHTRDRRSEIESARFKLDDTLSRSPSLARLMELEWKSLCGRAGLDARLILEESAALRELPTSELVLVTDDREAESEFGALTRLRLFGSREIPTTKLTTLMKITMHGVARRQPQLGPDTSTNWIRSALGRKSRAWEPLFGAVRSNYWRDSWTS